MKAKAVEMKQSIIVKDDKGMETWSAFHRDEGGNTYFLLDNEYAFLNVFSSAGNNYKNSEAWPLATLCNASQRVCEKFGKRSLIPVTLDLMSLDGLDTYGTCKGNLFGILTLDMYRNNRRNIKVSNDIDFFLCTPDSTDKGQSEYRILFVRGGGDIDYCYCSRSSKYIRPFFILAPETEVEVVEEKQTLGITFERTHRVYVEVKATAKEIEQLKNGDNPFHDMLEKELENGDIEDDYTVHDANDRVIVDWG